MGDKAVCHGDIGCGGEARARPPIGRRALREMAQVGAQVLLVWRGRGGDVEKMLKYRCMGMGTWCGLYGLRVVGRMAWGKRASATPMQLAAARYETCM